MSYTRNLTHSYASYFLGCGELAVSPYTGTFFAIAKTPDSRQENRTANIVAAAVVTGILTFVIPILPAIFSITSAVATVAALIAVASMFILYPLALLGDAIEDSGSYAFASFSA